MGDLKALETYQDSVYIYDSVTLAPLLGSAAVTCTSLRISNNAQVALTVQEVGLGVYRVTDFTPAAAGAWMTMWAAPAGNTVAGNYKTFKVGGGDVADIDTNIDAAMSTRAAAATALSTATWTALRAGYLDQLDFDLDARLGAPAGASLAADLLVIDNFVDDLETRLTAARAGYLDNINQVGLLQLTAARAGYLDQLDFDLDARLGAPAGASIAADLLVIDNLVDDLETRLTANRGGYLDELQAANLPADVDTLKAAIIVIDEFHDVPAQNAVANAQINEVIGNKTDDPTWFTDDVSSLMKWSKAAVSTGGGLTYSGKCDAGMVASTTTIVCDDLKGFPDDYFNSDWVMIVNHNDNSHGASPEGDAPRDITDYTGLSGTFIVTAFGANVEAEDKIIIQRRGLHITDAIGLKTTPATNSLAYRMSQFLASGDGDFATGTPLPSNISLYDIIGGANGHSAFPAAAAPANGINLMQVLRAIYDDTNELQTDWVNAGRLDALIDAIKARTDNHVQTRTFFSVQQEAVIVTDGATDLALPSVVLPNIAGTIVWVYAGFTFRMVENTNAGANKLNGAQYIQVNNAAEGLDNAIAFVDDQFSIAASTREGGTTIVGNLNMQASAHPIDAFNVTVTFQWTDADADLPNIEFNDVQTFLIVSYY